MVTMAPLFEEADSPLLKTFLINRLVSASEADPDVLSDYILALLRHDQSPEEVMQTCITQLADFMTSDPVVFVKDVFEALSTKSYLNPIVRKRSFDTATQSSSPQYPNKYPRQTYPQTYSSYPALPQPQVQQWPGIPPSRIAPWPGQGPPPPGWNSGPVPVVIPPQWPTPPPIAPLPSRPKVPRIKGTCYDYLEKGICVRGAACPYDHGIAPAVISPTGELEGTDPYDPLRPNNNSPPILQPVVSRPPPPPPIIQTNHRFEIHKGPNHHDKSNTTLVVEGIPPDKMNEASIREWFSQFGPLNQIIVDPSWGKAVLAYADYESAAKAWNDPRPVFSNRFVKIWWKKSDPPQESQKLSGGIVDQVELEIAREAAKKAQREHEEKQRRKQELEKKREELERQRVELLERQRVERERLMQKIKQAEEKAKDKARGVVTSASPAPPLATTITTTTESSTQKKTVNGTAKTDEPTATSGDDSARKAHLQKMLADLQNQAKALNIPPSEYTIPPLSDTRTKTTFRGSYRGRGSIPRGGRGRGGGGVSRSLDLRPKSIFVPGIVGTDHETSIREWVIMNCADATCESSPEDSTGIIVKFKERYEAEEFLVKLKDPPLGPLTGTWYSPKPVQQQNTNNIGDSSAGEVVDELGIGREYVYDDEEEREVGESEGRWKR